MLVTHQYSTDEVLVYYYGEDMAVWVFAVVGVGVLLGPVRTSYKTLAVARLGTVIVDDEGEA